MVDVVVIDKSIKTRIVAFKTTIIPRIGETICLPHFGNYKVVKVSYHISDECNSDKIENKITEIILLVKPL